MSGTGPASVVGQHGEYKLVVDWIAQAWVEIQASTPDWEFMRKDAALVVDAQKISLPTDCALPIALVLEHQGQKRELFHLPYGEFRERYRLTVFGLGLPVVWTNAGHVAHFSAIPDQPYPAELEYYRTPQILTEGVDTPLMPERFHMLIVYKAMEYYALYENAPEVLARARQSYNENISELSRSYRPAISLARPLV
ncbi:hypothetical protein [Neptunomonas marina]|uniref:Uncharacterized protein n=1 Tax=Neptunomonas marina TaxID=1815562 RepID=A0A437QDT9_9GAMM|nr:hypothetical protein [Neptunomonas marina]RVU32717.1 hypothetical protein EOE65_03415 [Neptunomonas marina]